MKHLLFTITLAILVNTSYSQVIFTDQSSLLLNNTIVSDHAIGIVDMNGDGKDDLIRIDNGEHIYYSYQNEANEEFTDEFILSMEVPSTGSANTWGLCAGDVDNDGINDLIAGGYFNGIYIIRTDINGDFISTVIDEGQIFVQGINTFDINNDGRLDIFACDDVDISDVYINNGAGSFTPDNSILNALSDGESDNSGNYGSVFTDIDNNGHCDLFIAKCRQGVTDPTDPRRINLAYMNYPGSGWISEGEERGLDSGDQSWIGAFGDFDNDADLDLIVGNHDVDSRFYINDGNGVFSDITEAVGLNDVFQFLTIQGSFVDFNNDSYLDFIMTGGSSCIISMNNGDGTFTNYDDLIDAQTNSFALGDLNHDGFIDILTSGGGYGGWSNSEPDKMFFNNGNNNNFLSVELLGSTSNLNGVGSRITITGPWGTQIRDVKSGQSYGIQNSLNQHFGLGEATIIDQITVVWPSGIVDSYTDIVANQFIKIEENGDLILDIDSESDTYTHLKLFPNPTTDYIQVEHNISEHKDLDFIIYDHAGKLILSQKANSDIRIDVRDLSNGIYNYTLGNSEVIFSGSFVKE